MNPMLAKLLTRIYPRSWRERYGDEFRAAIEMGPGGLRALVNIIGCALLEHIFPSIGGKVDTVTEALTTRSFFSVLRHPGGFLPLAMSFTALVMMLGDLAIYGVAHEVAQTDEGAVAHMWQLLMAGQVPIIIFFAIRWIPRAPRQAVPVLLLQTGAALASMAPIFLFGM